MSYDLMVFDPASAPTDRDAFLAWYHDQTEWSEDHRYDDPAVSTPELRAWFLEMIRHYPAMNGPFAAGALGNDTGYSVGRRVIYTAFRWSHARAARQTMLRLAEVHRVGFFDVSAEDGGVWMPTVDGGYLRIF